MHRTWLDEEIDRLVVSDGISPDDGMYRSDHGQWGKNQYLLVGRSALRCVRVAMLASGKTNVSRILDLPCGYGRVMRWLRAAFPEAEITACDLLTGGVDFCAETFGATPVYSRPLPQEIPLEAGFDLIWCGSLLTHLHADAWDGFLRLFSSLLVPGGLLVFTTHGRFVASRVREGNNYGLGGSTARYMLAEYNSTGFGFAGYDERHERETRFGALQRYS